MDKNPNTGRYVPKWTYELAAIEAAKFSTRQEFMKQNRGPYSYLKRTGRLNEACAHMPNFRPNYTVWDRESAFAEAKKYQRKGDFRVGSTGALLWLEKHGLVGEACAHMESKIMTKEQVMEAARRCATISDFKAKERSAYVRAHKKGWIKEAAAHMGPESRGWAKAEVLELALGYTVRADFIRENGSAYAYAYRRGWLDEVFASIPVSKRTKPWTYEEVKAEALKYTTRSEFDHNSSACAWARSQGVLDELCGHMTSNRITKEMVLAAARRYQHATDFIINCPGEYSHAYRHGYFREASAHMVRKPDKWTVETVMAEASKYKVRSDFSLGSSSAYAAARRLGVLEESCLHMGSGLAGFRCDLPGTLYFLCLDFGDDCNLYKIGITNRSVISRIKSMGVPNSIKVTILKTVHFPNGKDARDAENDLFIRFSDYWYDGPPVMANGNTELFTVNILPLLGDLLEPLAA